MIVIIMIMIMHGYPEIQEGICPIFQGVSLFLVCKKMLKF